MNKNQSYEILLNLIKAKHSEIVSTSSQLLLTMGDQDLGAKRNLANSLMVKITSLLPFMQNKDVPAWSHQAIKDIKEFTSGQMQPNDFLLRFLPLKSDIDKHQWDSNYSDGDHINFDVIYEHYRKESRLHDLFEQIIKSLEQIRDSGEVNSKAMIDSLTKIITTLRNSQDGSFLRFMALGYF